MLRLAHPAFLAAAVAAGGVVLALHLLARHERRAEPLPTARFVPDDVAASAVRVDRLRDLVLLALRLAAILLVGLAAARPEWTWRRNSRAVVLLVDRGSTVGARGLADTARAIAGADPAVVVAFDTAARVLPQRALADTTSGGHASASSLSAALVAGIRAAEPLRARYTRVELHLISPLRGGTVDAATQSIRALWPDSIYLHRMPVDAGAASAPAVDIDLSDDDPVSAAARLGVGDAASAANATVRMRRGEFSAADSSWGRVAGRVLVRWPPPRTSDTGDTLFAVVTMTGSVVGYFDRTVEPLTGTAIAWWGDGAVAASEVPNAGGCIRSVGFAPTASGDGALSFAMQRLMRRLAAPCGPLAAGGPLPDADVAMLVAPAPRPNETEPRVPAGGGGSLLPFWLLLAGVLALVVEQFVRARPGPVAAGVR